MRHHLRLKAVLGKQGAHLFASSENDRTSLFQISCSFPSSFCFPHAGRPSSTWLVADLNLCCTAPHRHSASCVLDRTSAARPPIVWYPQRSLSPHILGHICSPPSSCAIASHTMFLADANFNGASTIILYPRPRTCACPCFCGIICYLSSLFSPP
ncbi:hypothetical protein HYPSUDRAFT_38895 [Hypholoma sublateritium FD-334 SS-4]|uniref:Uncharacterized protein n=1 Tax=Hypholoma sublateritium (strain FD-334 SS-4) TaxID=945553 RepID=A0A0D2MKY9_HYPSF|nr:hypothetical protein HYPSUDRAFT_38895 [Hypholoma sublateritium FD-334 SS-4]